MTMEVVSTTTKILWTAKTWLHSHSKQSVQKSEHMTCYSKQWLHSHSKQSVQKSEHMTCYSKQWLHSHSKQSVQKSEHMTCYSKQWLHSHSKQSVQKSEHMTCYSKQQLSRITLPTQMAKNALRAFCVRWSQGKKRGMDTTCTAQTHF